jgi:hypothetical protein
LVLLRASWHWQIAFEIVELIPVDEDCEAI